MAGSVTTLKGAEFAVKNVGTSGGIYVDPFTVPDNVSSFVTRNSKDVGTSTHSKEVCEVENEVDTFIVSFCVQQPPFLNLLLRNRTKGSCLSKRFNIEFIDSRTI